MSIFQFLCGLKGHEVLTKLSDTAVKGECMKCGLQTPGWQLRPFSLAEAEEIYADLMNVEMSLHGGG